MGIKDQSVAWINSKPETSEGVLVHTAETSETSEGVLCTLQRLQRLQRACCAHCRGRAVHTAETSETSEGVLVHTTETSEGVLVHSQIPVRLKQEEENLSKERKNKIKFQLQDFILKMLVAILVFTHRKV